MSREVLNGPRAGFFGKLPVTGDFVSRGLPDAFRRHWDAWVTRHLAPRLRADAVWPEGGLRFRLVSGGRVAAGLILSGRDGAGRMFPLSLVVIGDRLPAPSGIDLWCAAVLPAADAALEGQLDADRLHAALAAIPVPAGEAPDAPAFALWSSGQPPVPCLPDAPAEALDHILTGTLSSG